MKPGKPQKAPKVSNPRPKENYMREYDKVPKGKNLIFPNKKKHLPS